MRKTSTQFRSYVLPEVSDFEASFEAISPYSPSKKAPTSVRSSVISGKSPVESSNCAVRYVFCMDWFHSIAHKRRNSTKINHFQKPSNSSYFCSILRDPDAIFKSHFHSRNQMNRCKLSSFYSFWSPYFLFWNPCKVSWDSLAPAFLVWIYLHATNMNIFKHSARNLTSVQKSGIMPFVTTYHLAVKNLKQLLMQEWSLIHNQPMLKNIYKTPPIISYRRGKSLKDILVGAKLWRHISQRRNRKDTWGSHSRSVMIFSQQSLNCVKISYEIRFFPVRVFAAAMFNFLGSMKHRWLC